MEQSVFLQPSVANVFRFPRRRAERRSIRARLPSSTASKELAARQTGAARRAKPALAAGRRPSRTYFSYFFPFPAALREKTAGRRGKGDPMEWWARVAALRVGDSEAARPFPVIHIPPLPPFPHASRVPLVPLTVTRPQCWVWNLIMDPRARTSLVSLSAAVELGK